MPDYSNQADFLVTVSDFGLFASAAAIEVSGSTTPVFDGGALEPYILGGRAYPREFELSRPFARARDFPLVKRFAPMVNRSWHQVSMQPTDNALEADPSIAPMSFRALLTFIATPALDAGSQDTPTPPMLTIRLLPPKLV